LNYLTVSTNDLFSSITTEWMKDIYYPPWCRAGPYFVGVLLGFVLFRINGKVKIHPVGASLFMTTCRSEIHYAAILSVGHNVHCDIFVLSGLEFKNIRYFVYKM